VENELATLAKREIPSTLLGEMALTRLRNLDQIAYVRFASVYRQFRSIEDFIAELNTLKDTRALLNADADENLVLAANVTAQD
jgi:transcriptional repressor NrdR